MPSNEGEDHNNIMIGDEDLEEEDDDDDVDSEEEDEEEDVHTQQTFTATIITEEEKKPSAAAFDDSRRLFQRLWTDEDEIFLLQGFLDYTSQRGGFRNSAYHHDTGPFYDQIKSKLQLHFNKNQLVEKLRRLKNKYRNAMSRLTSRKHFSFKTPHDQAAFQISNKIWTGLAQDHDEHGNATINMTPHLVVPPPSRKRSRSRAPTTPTPIPMPLPPVVAKEENVSYVIEETVKSCLSPLLKDLMVSAINGPGNGRGFGGMLPLSFGGNSSMNLLSGEGEKEVMDDKWKEQQILELEVLSKRVELVQEQIKLALEELRSRGGQYKF